MIISPNAYIRRAASSSFVPWSFTYSVSRSAARFVAVSLKATACSFSRAAASRLALRAAAACSLLVVVAVVFDIISHPFIVARAWRVVSW